MSSWFKKPLNVGITVGAAILAVVAAVLIIWGVTHHHEGGLLEVCWSEDGTAIYDTSIEGALGDGTCERSEELVWSSKQIPITIQAVEDEDQTRILAEAAADLNRQVGFELFRVVARGEFSSARISIQAFEVQADGQPAGHVVHRRTDEGLWGGVYIRSDVAAVDRTLYLVAEHEFLHLAGLEHDDFTLSIMYPLTREDWDADQMSTALVTDHDVRLLQKLYRR